MSGPEAFPFKIARGFLYLSALYVAIVTPSTLFPFIVGKYAWFRGTVDLALIAFALGLLFYDAKGEWGMRLKEVFRKPLVVAVGIFTLAFLLAGFFGVDPAMSFWSNFERGEGGIQLLHLFVFSMLLVALFRDEKEWRRFFVWALTGGALSILYGFFAAWDVPGFIGARFAESGFRFQASIGNPAYVAAMAIFLAFYVGYLLWSRYRTRLFVSVGAWALWGLLVFFGAAFILAATRGAFLGFLAGLLVGTGYFVFMHRAWRRWFVAGAIALVLTVGTMVFFKDSQFVKSIPGSRIFDISLTAETFQHRAIMWGMALEGWKERPLLGWGPENYIQVFDRKLDPAYFKPAEGFGAWFDRAHSIYFDYLAETGALGFLGFVGIFAVLGVHLFRREEKMEESMLPRALIIGAIVAYLVQGIALFDVLPIYYNLFVVLAFSAFYFSSPTLKPHASVSLSFLRTFFGVILILLSAASLIFGVYAPVSRARAYIGALQTMSSVNSIEGFKAHFNPAIKHWSPVGGEEVVKFLGNDILNIIAGGNQDEQGARALVTYIEPYIFKDNVRHLILGGNLYKVLWEKYGKREDDYRRAEGYYAAAFRIGPGLPPVLYSLLDLALKGGEAEKAQAVGAEILRLWPDAADVVTALQSTSE